MATDPDRQGDGRPARRRGRPLNVLPGGLHSAFQIIWAVASSFPLAAKVEGLVGRPNAATTIALIELSAIWAAVAGLAWTIRVLALSTCGTWGSRVRRRVRDTGRRRLG